MNEETRQITKRLDAIIYLLLKQHTQERNTPESEMIAELSELGLDLEVVKFFGETGRRIRWGHQ